MGLDGIHPRVLRKCLGVLAAPLTNLFNQSLLTGGVPQDWQTANIVPIHRKGAGEETGNYRPMSLTSAVVKLIESLLKKKGLTNI